MRESHTAIRFIVPEGSIVSAYTVAIGKDILARMSDEQLKKALPAVLSGAMLAAWVEPSAIVSAL